MIDKDDVEKIALAVYNRVKALVPLSKVQAYQYLNMRRSKFDTLVREGLIPKGKNLVGFKEKVWYMYELDIAITKLRKYGYFVN